MGEMSSREWQTQGNPFSEGERHKCCSRPAYARCGGEQAHGLEQKGGEIRVPHSGTAPEQPGTALTRNGPVCGQAGPLLLILSGRSLVEDLERYCPRESHEEWKGHHMRLSAARGVPVFSRHWICPGILPASVFAQSFFR